MSLPVFTLGHSTRCLEKFLALLAEHDIELLADVRRFPGSRRFPTSSAKRWPPAHQRSAWFRRGGRRASIR